MTASENYSSRDGHAPTGSMSLARIRLRESFAGWTRTRCRSHNDNNLSSAEIYDRHQAHVRHRIHGESRCLGRLLLSNGQVLIPHFSGPDEVSIQSPAASHLRRAVFFNDESSLRFSQTEGFAAQRQ